MKFSYTTRPGDGREIARALLSTRIYVFMGGYFLFLTTCFSYATGNLLVGVFISLVLSILVFYLQGRRAARVGNELIGAVGTKWEFDFQKEFMVIKTKDVQSKVAYSLFASMKLTPEFILLKQSEKGKLRNILPRPNEEIVQFLASKIKVVK